MGWQHIRNTARFWGVGGRGSVGPMLAAGALAVLGGCKADYAVDITNKTPQPVFAQIMRKGGTNGMLGASVRLGPGDRSGLGPVRTEKDHGAYLTVDTLGNPGRPVTMDLAPGAVFVEVQQDGEGPNSRIRVVEKR